MGWGQGGAEMVVTTEPSQESGRPRERQGYGVGRKGLVRTLSEVELSG